MQKRNNDFCVIYYFSQTMVFEFELDWDEIHHQAWNFLKMVLKKKCTAFYIGYIGSSMAIIAHSGENVKKIKCDFSLALS